MKMDYQPSQQLAAVDFLNARRLRINAVTVSYIDRWLSYDAAAVRSLLLTSRRLPSIDKHTGRVRVRHDRGELEPDGACPNPPNPPTSPNTTTIIINSIHITVTITRLRHCKVISSYDHSHNRNTLPIATLRNTIRREWTARRQDGGRHSDTTL